MKKFNTAYSRARFSRFRVLQNRDREEAVFGFFTQTLTCADHNRNFVFAGV
jgi:hypothetical protein